MRFLQIIGIVTKIKMNRISEVTLELKRHKQGEEEVPEPNDHDTKIGQYTNRPQLGLNDF